MKKLSILLCALFLLGTLCLPVHAEEDYELLVNGDFEQVTLDWEKYYLGTVDYCNDAHTGSSAFRITNRQHSTDIARQDITKQLAYYGAGNYEISAWVRLDDPNAEPIDVCIAIGAKGTGKDTPVIYATSNWVRVTSEWTYICATRYVYWVGDELEAAEFYLITPQGGEEDQTGNFRDLLLDDCSMKVLSYSGEPYAPETTEAPTTEPPATEPPTTESPTTEAPSTEEPTTELPSTEEPTTQEPTSEEPTTEVPSSEEPTTQEPATEEPTTQALESTDEPEEEITTEPPEELTTDAEQQDSISAQTWVITCTMVASGIILLGCAIALTVSYVRGKRHEASN